MVWHVREVFGRFCPGKLNSLVGELLILVESEECPKSVKKRQ